MSRRNIQASDDDVEDGLLKKEDKKVHGNATANYDLLRLRDMERFIFKFYWMVILMYIAIGVALVSVLSEHSFSDIFMAESLLNSLGVTMYIILFMMLLMCHSHREMRIVILLTLCFFIGVVGGFLVALHLLNVTIDIKKT